MIPNPDLSNIPVARERTFVFGSGASQNQSDSITSFITEQEDNPVHGA